MKSKLVRVLLYLAAFVVGILLIVYLVAWKSPKYIPVQQQVKNVSAIIPFSKYDSINNHPRPMVLEKETVLIFGATHTKNPKDPQLDLIEEKWNQLKPTVALVEGRLGFLLPLLMDPVEHLGEGGLVKHLANRDNVPLYNWDLSKEELAKQLQKKFNPEQIALQQILNPYFGNLRHGKPSDPDGFVEEYIARAENVGLQDSIKTIADVNRLWNKYFPSINWRNVSDEYALPGFLHEMMSYSNDLRNEKLVATVTELKAKGERIFVVCGSSHAACVQHVIF